MLLAFRVVQGFSGGVLIPAVFSAVFLLFPSRLHAVATTVAGVVAVLAPTIGPVVGGFITETWSWPWLFLINVIPGLVAASATPFLLPRQETNFAELSKLDLRALVLMAAALASLEIGLKQAPLNGWLSLSCAGLLAASAIAAGISICLTLALLASGAAAYGAEAALVRGRLCVELLPRRRAVRLGLSDAGVSGLRARS